MRSNIRTNSALISFFSLLIMVSCISPDNRVKAKSENTESELPSQNTVSITPFIDTTLYVNSGYEVIFLEFGSLVCYSCQQMQIVLKSVEEKYGDQVKVVFHDVRTPEGRSKAEMYNISIIPAQVFLDKNGREYYRHEDYFGVEEVVAILNMKGVE
jgi:thioredoxin 1